MIIGGLIVSGGLGFPVLADVVEWPTRRRLSLHTRLTIQRLGDLDRGGHDRAAAGRESTGRGAERRAVASTDRAERVPVDLGAHGGFFGDGEYAAVDGGEPGAVDRADVHRHGARFDGRRHHDGHVHRAGAGDVELCAPVAIDPGAASGQIPADAVRRASAVLLVALLVVAGATWLILLEQPAPLDSVVFEVVSAFSTTGLSLSYTTQLSSFGLVVIMLCMLWGRLGALTIIAALGEQRPPERVEYPEERLLLG